MKVLLVGYGKMGKAIEEILIERRHLIVGRLNRKPEPEDMKEAEVAIEFSKPEVAFENISALINHGVPVISGTTGWISKIDEIIKLNTDKDSAFLYASNFSLGVNLFFELNEYLSRLMSNYPEYNIELKEIHHTKKLDKPSGTAITLAQKIIENTGLQEWESDHKSNNDILPIYSVRTDNVPGTHTVAYRSNIDDIEIIHTAHSRKGFALGAVLAAEWIIGKKGCFSMKDVLGLK